MADPRISEIVQFIIFGLLVAGIIAGLFYYLLERKKNNEFKKSEERFWGNIK